MGMKAVHFHCPECGQKMQCAENDRALETRCGVCGKMFVPTIEARSVHHSPPRIAKFHCPNCHEKIKADSEIAGREIECPTCQFKFIPAIEETAEEVGPPLAVPPDSATPSSKGGIPLCDPRGELTDSADRGTLARSHPRQADELHTRADTAGMVGTFLLIVSLIALIIVWTGDSDIRPSATIVSGGCFFFALFLFVIAQLIHIRANTEK